MLNTYSQSFSSSSDDTITLSTGQIAHRDHAAHSVTLERQFFEVSDGVWCLVGNGLSNQTFVRAPEGIIAIDTGESIEEMREALRELRAHTSAPIAAVLYTHFHYVSGTKAVFEDTTDRSIPIWGHQRIDDNRVRTASEIAPAYSRGLAQQFALLLPTDGADANVNVGLGKFFRDSAHAPFTPGYVAADHTFGDACTISVAGLDIDVMPAPSDADDSVTFWFPAPGVAVNNLVWPTLFNVFAIRGEEYRDPRGMLTGIDHLLGLQPTHLVGAHGPPLSGVDTIQARVTRYRDSLQFLWDQTVRATNRGLTSNEIGHSVRLPALYGDDYLTTQFYGVVEHHVRQIRSGLFGWFDGDESQLFPLPTQERARRMVEGFGGPEVVRTKARDALRTDDLRWAVELGSWLVRSEDDPLEAASDDRAFLAMALRTVGQRTTSANIRSWCLTRALELEGAIDTTRFRSHRFTKRQVLNTPPARTIHLLRVMIDPDRAEGIDLHIGWHFPSGSTGLHLRNCVACPTDGAKAAISVRCDIEAWADVVTNVVPLSEAISDGRLVIEGSKSAFREAMACFDVVGLRS